MLCAYSTCVRVLLERMQCRLACRCWSKEWQQPMPPRHAATHCPFLHDAIRTFGKSTGVVPPWLRTSLHTVAGSIGLDWRCCEAARTIEQLGWGVSCTWLQSVIPGARPPRLPSLLLRNLPSTLRSLPLPTGSDNHSLHRCLLSRRALTHSRARSVLDTLGAAHAHALERSAAGLALVTRAAA
jgi:hypothetical protein